MKLTLDNLLLLFGFLDILFFSLSFVLELLGLIHFVSRRRENTLLLLIVFAFFELVGEPGFELLVVSALHLPAQSKVLRSLELTRPKHGPVGLRCFLKLDQKPAY